MQILNFLLNSAFEAGTLRVVEKKPGVFVLQAKVGMAYISLCRVDVSETLANSDEG